MLRIYNKPFGIVHYAYRPQKPKTTRQSRQKLILGHSRYAIYSFGPNKAYVTRVWNFLVYFGVLKAQCHRPQAPKVLSRGLSMHVLIHFGSFEIIIPFLDVLQPI